MSLAGDYMEKGLSQHAGPAARFMRYPEALAKCARPFAQLAVAHHPFFVASAPHCLRHLEHLNPQHLASLLWAWAASGPWDEVMLRKLRSRFCDILHGQGLRGLAVEDVQHAVWALDATRLDGAKAFGTLACAIPSHSAPPQQLAVLCDHAVSHAGERHARLRRALTDAADLLGSMCWRDGAAPSWHSSSYVLGIQQLEVEHYGQAGTRALLRLLGFQDPPPEARDLAMRLLAAGRGTTGARCGSCAMMYVLRAPDGTTLLEGSSCHNARMDPALCCDQSDAATRRQPLRAAQLLVGRAADRERCAEVLALGGLCEQLGRRADVGSAASRGSVGGAVLLHLLAAPCVSGLGVARQFQLAFRGVEVSVSFED
mmetsp:Transcript_95021/g.277857  ORF Transcript_95021/g.277857 Transcript_95021/m.277857 type:complete len:371 (+) Transcript_95021:1-1113(+)